MTNLTLSRRYAKALLALGQEDGNYEKYGQEIGEFAALLKEQPDLREALIDRAYPAIQRRAVLEGVLGISDLSGVVKNFFMLLQEKDRMGLLEEICQVYKSLVDELSGVMRARVTSAASLNSDAEGRVRAALEKLTGKKIIMETEEDPDLLGGLVARVGDVVLDGSLKTQLESLKDSLKGVG